MENLNYNQLGDDIVRLVGGTDNVNNLEHCVTRLRFSLRDESKAQTEDIKKLKGVISVVNANRQYQVVLGGEVIPTYDAIMKKHNFESSGQTVDAEPDAERRKGIKGIWEGIMDYLSGTMVQIIPLFIGCGLISCILSVSTIMFGVDNSTATYKVLNSIANSVFYFLPGFIGFAAARKLKCSPFLGAIICLFLLHPNFTGLVGADIETTFFGIPFQALNYSSTVFPALIGTWVLSKIEKPIYNALPKVLKTVFGPFLCILIMAPLMLFLIGPVGYYIGTGLANMILALQNLPLGIGCGLLSAAQLLLVMLGAHTVLAPPMIESINIQGYDALIRPAFIMASFAGFGACLAVSLKAKDKEFKGFAVSATVTQFLGTAEPALYGIYLPLMKPLVATMIGAFCGGVTSSLMGAKAYAMGKNGIFGWLVFQDTLPAIIVASAVAAVVAFALVWILGFDESKVTK